MAVLWLLSPPAVPQPGQHTAWPAACDRAPRGPAARYRSGAGGGDRPVQSAAYRRSAGAEPPYPAAQAFAAGVIASRCVRDAGSTADGALRAAALDLDCTTMFSRFRLDPMTGEQVGQRILTVQWQDGRRCVVWPPEQAEAQLRGR